MPVHDLRQVVITVVAQEPKLRAQAAILMVQGKCLIIVVDPVGEFAGDTIGEKNVLSTEVDECFLKGTTCLQRGSAQDSITEDQIPEVDRLFTAELLGPPER